MVGVPRVSCPSDRSAGTAMAFFKNFSLVNRALFPAPEPSYDALSLCVTIGGVRSTAMLIPIGSGKSVFPGVFVEPVNPQGGLLIYFHGNGADVGDVHDLLIDLASRLRVHVLAVEYPGYGICPNYGHSSPSEDAIDSFAFAAWRFVTDHLRFDPGEIILFGRSIGTGPAAKLASRLFKMKKKPAALILQSPYTSVKGLVRGFGGAMKLGSNFLLQRWDTQNNIKEMLVPVLILHGDRDQLIPLSNGQAIARSRAKLPSWCKTELFVQRGADHNRFNHDTHVLRPIQHFVRGCRDNTAADEISQFDLQRQILHVRSQIQKFSVLHEAASKSASSPASTSSMWKIGRAIFGASMAASEASLGSVQSSFRPVKSAQEQEDR